MKLAEVRKTVYQVVRDDEHEMTDEEDDVVVQMQHCQFVVLLYLQMQFVHSITNRRWFGSHGDAIDPTDIEVHCDSDIENISQVLLPLLIVTAPATVLDLNRLLHLTHFRTHLHSNPHLIPIHSFDVPNDFSHVRAAEDNTSTTPSLYQREKKNNTQWW